MERLEDEGRFRFLENYGRSEDDRARALRGVYDEEMGGGRGLWASFDWTKDVDFERALGRQGELTRFVADRHLVVQTTVLEPTRTSSRRPWGGGRSSCTRRHSGYLRWGWRAPGLRR